MSPGKSEREKFPLTFSLEFSDAVTHWKKKDTDLNIAAAANAIFTLSLKTNRRVQENVAFLRNIILDDRVPANELKFLLRSLNYLGSLLKKSETERGRV
nr:hypothetical protein [Tanacetum cinerariifolium]